MLLEPALLPAGELTADCAHWPKAAEQGLRCGVYLVRDEVGEVAISNDLGRDVSRAVGGRHKGRRDSLLEESDPIEVFVP